MHSENTSDNHTEPDSIIGDPAILDYDSEGLAFKAEGAKEGNLFPNPDDNYPLRDPSEDPAWAVKIVAIWAGTAIFFIIFILVFMVLGIWYD